MLPFLTPLGQDQVPEDVAAMYRDFETHLGGVPTLLKILARRPSYAHLLSVMRSTEQEMTERISKRQQLLIAAQMAVLEHAPYAMRGVQERNDMYSAMPPELLEAILQQRVTTDLASAQDQLLLDLATRVHRGTMDTEFWNGLAAHYSDTEILDLLVVACNQQWLASISRAVGLTSLDVPDLPDAPPV